MTKHRLRRMDRLVATVVTRGVSNGVLGHITPLCRPLETT